MVHQTAIVQIDGADHGVFIVCQITLGVDKTRRILVNFDAGRHESGIKAPGHHKHQFFTRNVGNNDAHIHTEQGCVFHIRTQVVVDNEIGAGHPAVVGGGGEHILNDALANMPFVDGVGAVTEGDQPAGFFHFRLRRIQIGSGLRQITNVNAVVYKKQLCQFPHCLALQSQAGILPVAEALHLIDVLVSDINAAGISHLAVNDRALSVTAVVELTVGIALEPGEG